MGLPGLRLHPLKGERHRFRAVDGPGNYWRGFLHPLHLPLFNYFIR